MADLRPDTKLTRPATARPRSDPEHDAVRVDPPTPDEVQAIARHLATLALHSGATAVDDPHLDALLLRTPDGGIALNYVARPRWTAENWPARLGAVADAMRAAGEWPSLLIAEGVDEPAGLERDLSAAGWSRVNHETVLWVGAASVVPHLDPSLRIEAVQPTSIAAHQALEADVFGLGRRNGGVRGEEFEDALRGGGLRAYVVRVDGEPVAVARLSSGEKDAALYGIGVAPGSRRRGMGTLITTVATRAGLALGKRIVWLSVEDGNDGAWRMYERLGFQTLFGWGRWISKEP